MLTENKALSLGNKKIIELLGKEFLKDNIKNTCLSVGKDGDLYDIFVGVSEENTDGDIKDQNGKVIGIQNDERPFRIFANVVVNLETEEVTVKKYKKPE